MSFDLYSSNKLEELAELYRKKIHNTGHTADAAQMIVPEIVITQTKGVADWLKLELAKNSIAANIEFLFVQKFIDAVLKTVLAEGHDAQEYTGNFVQQLLRAIEPGSGSSFNPLNREDMTWDIFQYLSDEKHRAHEVKIYLEAGGASGDLRRYQLSEKLAELYDQYQIYHSKQLEKWKKETPAEWQGRLYRDLFGKRKSIADYFEDFAKKATCLPKTNARITVFGVSAMPESYFKFFRNLAKICDVHFFYLNPCEDYWSDILTAPQAATLQKRHPRERKYFEKNGNQLLASLGVQARNFYCLRAELYGEGDDEDEHFVDYSGDNMLAILQNDVLKNHDLGQLQENEQSCAKIPVDADDRSITVHNCHTPLREVEVLCDQLKDLFSKDKELQPRDVIVMAPDITKYEPYIRAVFGDFGQDENKAADSGYRKKYYALCDRSIKTTNETAAAFLGILNLCKGKFTSTEVFELLEYPCLNIRRKISDNALAKIRQYVIDTGIRWGVDGAHREDVSEVNFDEYSWEHGINRMLLGYAVYPDDDSALTADIMAADTAEGQNAAELGEFIAFIHNLFQIRNELQGEQNLSEWCRRLTGILDTLFCNNDDYLKENTKVWELIEKLASRAEQAEQKISFDLLLYLLEKNLGDKNASEPFLRGKITFCSMMPMRSIPMKAVAILGMNDGEFPRRNFTSEFDVTPPDETLVGCSPNQEDRFMFLEAILSARQNLLLFYQGRDSEDNSVKPPAVPLGELMDQLRLTFDLSRKDEYGNEHDMLETMHKLQAFDPDYFRQSSGQEPVSDTVLTDLQLFENAAQKQAAKSENTRQKLFSYSEQNCNAAKVLAGKKTKKNSAAGLRKELTDMLKRNQGNMGFALPETLPLAELESFFKAPQEKFLAYNADLFLKEYSQAELQDEEPVELDHLTGYNLRQELAEWILAGEETETKRFMFQKSNRLPVGEIGTKAFNNLEKELDFLTDEIRERINSCIKETLSVEIELSDGTKCTLTAELPLAEDGTTYYYWRAADFTAKDAVSFYLRHLLFSAAKENTVVASCAYFKNKPPAMPAIDHITAKEYLGELLDLYQQGHKEPLCIFTKASYEYATAKKPAQEEIPDNESELQSARQKFCSKSRAGDKETGDYINDKAVAMLFEPEDFDDPSFADTFKAQAGILHRAYWKGSKENNR